MGKLVWVMKTQRKSCRALSLFFPFISAKGVGEDGGCGNCAEEVKLAEVKSKRLWSEWC